MYDDILLATDGTIASENATAHAVGLASLHDAMLHAIFVVDSDVYSAYSGDEYVDEREGPEHGLEEVGEDALAEVRTRAANHDVEVIEELRHGHPHEEIVEYADENDIDLIVLGTRRHPEEYRSLLGSVTDRVVRLADQAVTVVKTEV
ncbi:universal stress protein [Haloplanus aerogenes]|uniref:Nucleotide-binding universal stress UspA family protein n=1 Tax=Haloplanus aerogenes TaxID=660522 RepID=A0A3M0D8K9_9EURY|nr:universal stress protein [Haloplanus aerogenes]AZH26442.1 universal stress protein [Haloplanus aerogenes]RMB18092.1 nucleotide-binding universal stress UspA family protein [Haloplanus aerogenes]